MNNQLKFTIVMPAYNVEPYLRESVMDIVEQTYQNWELIIVDDCATDGTGKLADQLAETALSETHQSDSVDVNTETQVPVIRVIHQPENQGVSTARNTGLAGASGDYILFLDPDDRYDHRLLETVHAAVLGSSNPDVVVYSLSEDYYDTEGEVTYSVVHKLPTQTYDCRKPEVADSLDDGIDLSVAGKNEADADDHAVEMHRAIARLEEETMLGYPWNKAYKLAYLRKIKATYPKIVHIEDIMFNLAVMEQVESLTILEDVLYHYRNQGQVRLTEKYLPDYLKLQKTRIQAFLSQQENWNSMDDQAWEYTSAFYYRAYMSAIEREIAHGTDRQQILQMAVEEQKSQLHLKLREHLPKGGKMTAILYRPLADGRVKTAVRRAHIISFVRHKFPGVFAKLKQNR